MKTIRSLTSASFGKSTRNMVHFFGTRHGPSYGGGREERGTVQTAAPDYPVVVSVRQVHGTDVLVLDRPLSAGERFLDGWDAIITNQVGMLVTIRTADCVPVLVADVVHGLVGAVHAGWRGAVRGIVAKSLRAMVERFGADFASLQVAMGPSVGPCCYEVDTPVLEQLPTDLPDASTILTRTSPRTGQLDLKALIRQQALSLGIADDRIHSVDMCTTCRADLLFSYRRDGNVHGTMVNGIMLT
ncbi:MAG: peptidoglycan editing factor PgeF [Nitrospira sp.]|nr:peptidoglycan editing factor PgeF [Nitrospira sp.]